MSSGRSLELTLRSRNTSGGDFSNHSGLTGDGRNGGGTVVIVCTSIKGRCERRDDGLTRIEQCDRKARRRSTFAVLPLGTLGSRIPQTSDLVLRTRNRSWTLPFEGSCRRWLRGQGTDN